MQFIDNSNFIKIFNFYVLFFLFLPSNIQSTDFFFFVEESKPATINRSHMFHWQHINGRFFGNILLREDSVNNFICSFLLLVDLKVSIFFFLAQFLRGLNRFFFEKFLNLSFCLFKVRQSFFHLLVLFFAYASMLRSRLFLALSLRFSNRIMVVWSKRILKT